MPRRRPGSEMSCLSLAIFTLAASENSRRASVISASTWIDEASTSIVTGPHSGLASTYPAIENTSGAVRFARSSRSETAAHPTIRNARMANPASDTASPSPS